jgi:hypothetical protein
MEVEKTNPNPLEGLKEQFLRMQSPSAFGSIRRFDDTSFMNVPPEMARRDAAFIQMEKIIYDSFFSDSCKARRRLYSNMISRLKMIVKKTSFIRKAQILEKRDLEGGEVLELMQLILRYFLVLDEMADSQSAEDEGVSPLDVLLSQSEQEQRSSSLESDFYRSECSLFQSIKKTLHSIEPIFSAMQSRRRKMLSKGDSLRYEKAYVYYMEYYASAENQ